MRATMFWALIVSTVVMGLVIPFPSPANAQVCGDASPPSRQSPSNKRPHHVFIIVFENEGFDVTFGPRSKAPYLRDNIAKRGKLLRQYYAIGHFSLDNYIAMISGQAPNTYTQNDCPTYYDFAPLRKELDKDGQALGVGCVYPESVLTVANQLDSKTLPWGAYMEDMEPNCERPRLGAADDHIWASKESQYATRHNPFVYFHSIVDHKTCAEHVMPLSRLDHDLRSVETTPNLVFISPNLCDDGHDEPTCVDGEIGGLAAVDRFLVRSKLVDRITASSAFKQDGMLIITFDEADLGGDWDDYSSCCVNQTGPNTPAPGRIGPGGGRIGTIIISKFVRAGTKDDIAYNHYSLLRSIEDLFDFCHLGYAGQDGLRAFGSDVYDAGL